MNNWCLLLLAVVAVIHPIESFTKLNLFDGRQECCDHNSYSVTEDNGFYGTYRENKPQQLSLSSKENDFQERRYEARHNLYSRSQERLTLDRTERRFSPESQVRFSARDQDHSHRSATAKDFRQELTLRTRNSFSRDSIGKNERDVLDSRDFRMNRDDIRIGHFANERLNKNALDSRDARRIRDPENHRRVSTKRETMILFERKSDDVYRDGNRRESRNNSFRSVTRLQLGNSREHRFSDQRSRDIVHERRSQSLVSRLNSVNTREGLRSQIDSRENRRIIFRATAEGIEEPRIRSQNRDAHEKTNTLIRDKSERVFSDHRRDTVGQINRSNKEIRRNHNNERIDERRIQSDEYRLSRERLSILRVSKLSTSIEGRPALTRESRISKEFAISARTMSDNSNDDRTNERRQLTRKMIYASRDSTTERRQHSRVLQTLEAPVRDERLIRNERDERQQQSTGSLDRVSVRRSTEREYNSARFLEKNVRDDGASRYRSDVRNMKTLHEGREHRDENRISRDSTTAMVRNSRISIERLMQETRRTSLSRIGTNARLERKSTTHEDVRGDIRHSKSEELKLAQEQILHNMVVDAGRRQDRKISKISRITERTASSERVSRMNNLIRSERFSELRQSSTDNARDSILEMQLIGIRDTSRYTEINDRPRQTRTQDSRMERREARERNENKMSHDRTSMTRRTIKMIENQRRESRGISDAQVGTRNVIARSYEDVRISRDGVMAVRINTREVRNNNRDFRAIESRRESKKLTEREVEPNRPTLAMERMDRSANRANRNIRIGANLRTSDIVVAKHMLVDTRGDAIDNRFQSFEANIRSINPEHTSTGQSVMTWQTVFYTLQGAYLIGLLMQMLTEKAVKGKSRNFACWAASYKELIKVD